MDALIKQMRRRIPAAGQGWPEDRDKRASSRQTQSFKEKKSKSWFQRQFSRQMSRNDNDVLGDEEEVAIAIAAAAYAVNKLNESELGKTSWRREDSFTKMKANKEVIAPQGPVDSSEQISGEQEPANEGRKAPTGGPPVRKRPTFAEKVLLDTTEGGELEAPHLPPKRPPQPAMDTEGSPLPKFPTTILGHPPLGEIQTEKVAGSSSLNFPTTKLAEQPSDTKRQITAVEPIGAVSKADVWERDKMARIRVKYEKLNLTMDSWENDKKKKARSKLDGIERELERRRANALKEFRDEMERIEQITGGARAQAVERRRNEELKAREKANKMRRTGKAPPTCFCF